MVKGVYGYHVNLNIESPHFLRNQNPDNVELREHDIKEKQINDGCQYQY